MDDEKKKKRAVTSQVLDYYKKHSRDKDLSRYFCGSSGSLVAESPIECSIKKNTESAEILKPKSCLKVNSIDESDDVDVNINIEIGDHVKPVEVKSTLVSEADNLKASSPTSSVNSNKKLEWDNGADIGYENCDKKILHKSLSLPVLSTLEKVALQKTVLQQSNEDRKFDLNKIQRTTSNTSSTSTSHKDIFASSSSSSVRKEIQKEYFSSTSATSAPQRYETSTESSDCQLNKTNFISKNVGNPLAESTPYINVKKSAQNFLENQNIKQTFANTTKNLRKKNHSSSCENLSSTSSSGGILKKWNSNSDLLMKNKMIKLCISKPVTLECFASIPHKDEIIQTSLSRNKSMAVQTDTEQKAKLIEQINYNNSAYIERQKVIYLDHLENKNIVPPLNLESIISNSNSFEFIPGKDLQPSESNSSSSETETETTKNNLRRSTAKSNLTTLSLTSQSSRSSPLGDLLSAKHSSLLISDIEKSIDLLQKLLKSKKYDSVTKKHYLKKIVQKIINNQYVDDSSTDLNEENNKMKQNFDAKKTAMKLKENVPWVPAPQKSSDRKEENLKMETNRGTGSSERSSKLRYPQFTITDRSHNNSLQASKDTQGSGEKSWREEKTLSEKLFEEKLGMKTDLKVTDDHVLNFAKKERENQLNWINNEISHLDKLRQLLKTNKLANKDRITKIINKKPCIEDLKAAKTSTAVYMITTERNKCDCRGCCGCPKMSAVDGNLPPEPLQKCTCKNPLCRICNCPPGPGPSYEVCAGLRGNSYKKPNLVGPPLRESQQEFPDELKHAKLLSSETYVNNDSPNTCIRRYVFEVPLSDLQRNINDPISQRPSPQNTLKQLEESRKHDERSSNDSNRIKFTENNPRYNSVMVDNEKPAPDTGTRRAKDSTDSRNRPISPTNSYKSTGQISEAQNKSPTSEKRSLIISVNQDCGNASVELSNETKQEPCPEQPCGSKETCECKTLKDACNNTEPVAPDCKCKEQKYTSETSSSSSSSSSSSNLCPCCQKCYVPSNPSSTSMKSNKNSNCLSEILCFPCYNNCRKDTWNSGQPYYTYPGHVCNNYTMINRRTLQEIRNTVHELSQLEKEQNCCTCNFRRTSKKRCYCKTTRKKGVAYTLKFEPGDSKKEASNLNKERSLEEVTIKIPCQGRKQKKHDFKENEPEKKKKHKHKHHTLQEYLCCNRPDFIQSAEDRRKCMLELAYMREKRCEKYKQLLALTSENNSKTHMNQQPKRLFTGPEMKKITAKNYKKLPEVQQKLIDHKKQQIRKANRMLANIFNKKLKDNVLKGVKDISTTVSVLNMN